MASSPAPALAASYPLHVILAAYPTACFTGAFLTDIAYVWTDQMQWANFSAWLITAGLVMGALAAIAGIVELFARRAVQLERPWMHSLGNLAVLLLSFVNILVHSRDAYTSVMPEGLILSGIVAVLVLITSWSGTALVYRQHIGAVK